MKPMEINYEEIALQTENLPLKTTAEASIEAHNNFQYGLDIFDRAKAGFEMGFDEGMLVAGVNKVKRIQDEAKASPILAPEELNAMFPELERPFGEPTKLSVAQGIAQREHERTILMQKLAAGDYTTPLALISGMAGGLSDPVNLALDILLTKGLSTGARALGVANRIEKLGKFGSSVTYAAAANIPQEWVIAGLNEEEQRDITTTDIVANSLVGATAFAGLGAAARGMKHIYAKYRSPKNTIGLETAMTEVAQNKKIDVDKLANEEAKFMPNKESFPSISKEEYNAMRGQLLDQSDAVSSINSYYKNKDILSADTKVFSVAPRTSETGRIFTPEGNVFLGNGFYASRSKLSEPLIKSDFSMGDRIKDGKYSIEAAQYAFNPNTAKLYDLHVPLDTKFVNTMKGLISSNLTAKELAGIKEIMPTLMSAKNKTEFLEKLRDFVDLEIVSPKVFEDLRTSFKGFDGFKYIDDMNDPGDATSYFLFNPKKSLQAPEAKMAELETIKDSVIRDMAVKEQSLNDLEKFFAFDSESNRYFLAEDLKILKDPQTKAEMNLDPQGRARESIKESQDIANEADELLNEAFSQGSEEFMMKSSKAEFEEIKALKAEMEESSEIFKAAFNCISKGN